MKRCARSLWRQAQLNPRITAGDFDVLIYLQSWVSQI